MVRLEREGGQWKLEIVGDRKVKWFVEWHINGEAKKQEVGYMNAGISICSF
jgi:hypothetical protein